MPVPATIAVDDPRADDVRALLERHLAFANATTAPEDVHALDVDRLVDPRITFFSARAQDGDAVLGVAALQVLEDDRSGEVKSMHTAAEARGTGVARALLDHLIAVARERGYSALFLETGSGEPFAPARRLYARAGFVPCGAFADYEESPARVLMRLDLDRPGSA